MACAPDAIVVPVGLFEAVLGEVARPGAFVDLRDFLPFSLLELVKSEGEHALVELVDVRDVVVEHEVKLADPGRVVAALLERAHEGRQVRQHVAGRVVEDAVVVRVQAGGQRGPR